MKNSKISYLMLLFLFVAAALAILDLMDINFAEPKLEQKEEILLSYKNGDFTLYPEDENESYILPINTKLNVSIIKLEKYNNQSFVNLTIPYNVKYVYTRGFISSRENKTLVLSWR